MTAHKRYLIQPQISKMKLQILLEKQVILAVLILFSFTAKSQNIPILKYIDKNTIEEVKIDYDQDGDTDFILVGVVSDRDQGRVYLVENKGSKLGKPEYIYSFPTISVKQQLDINQKDNITTINVVGTAPDNKQTKYVVTLYKGKFEGMLVPPITSNLSQ